MPVSPDHDVKDLSDVLFSKIFMEEVAHTIDEDRTGFAPVERKVKSTLNESDLASPAWSAWRNLGEALIGLARTREARGQRFCVAITTPLGDTRATSDGIPGALGPLNLGHAHVVRGRSSSRRTNPAGFSAVNIVAHGSAPTARTSS